MNRILLIPVMLVPFGLAFVFPQTQAKPAKGYPAVHAILKTHCLGCHRGKGAGGGFDVSSYAKVMAGSRHGKMVVPKKPTKSPLMAYLKGTKKPAMPMGGKPLKAADLKIISDWIASGAKNK